MTVPNIKNYLTVFSVMLTSPIASASTNATVSTTIAQTNKYSVPNPGTNATKNVIDNHSGYTPSSAVASYTLSADGESGYARSTASAHASAGYLGVYAASDSMYSTKHQDAQGNLSGAGGGSADTHASANWYDLLTINASGMNGRLGSFSASIVVSGNALVHTDPGVMLKSPDGGLLLASNEGRSSVSLAGSGLNWPTQTWDDACGGGQLACANTSYGFSPIPNVDYHRGTASITIPVTINFRFGIAQTIGYSLSVSSHALSDVQYFKTAGSGGVNAVADLSHTLLWGGIDGFFDDQGNAISNFSLSASSGFDYSQAAIVPLPLSAWLMLSALMGWLGLRRKQSRVAA
ncbi:hypothetical protein BJL95_05875 [Methylomonas sp. LWB]|uniref:hypothetical protein n=1 Tax=Methylomonas sp. LWB TaxID=1905845 RepID=UPI0008DAE115|nr:hypothetical protein [Methylomonas sp. LWB]OHX34021.1 hypothetical protein BJL95_05875 [Methylomonas sp. LWB]